MARGRKSTVDIEHATTLVIILLVGICIIGALLPQLYSQITGINYTDLGPMGTAAQAIMVLLPGLVLVVFAYKAIKTQLKD